MRKRRRSIAPKLSFAAGVVLLLVLGILALPSLVRHGWIDPAWQEWLDAMLGQARRFAPSDEQIGYLKWLAGLVATTIGAASALFISWHFAEINLPQRIQSLKKAHERKHLQLQPAYLALSRRGLGSIPADIETSRLTLLRKWLSGWSKKEQARVLAASVNQLAKEASALSAATSEAQQELITAHLIRGYQHATDGDDGSALEEFEAATQVQLDNVLSRDIAAGCARRLGRQKREFELLDEMQKAASNVGADVAQARALRRRAELLEKREDDQNWHAALRCLRRAQGLVEPIVAAEEAKSEMVRILTLYCEIQCDREVVRMLAGPNGRFTKLLSCADQVEMRSRPEERGGEDYSRQRVADVGQRITDLLADPEVQDDADDEPMG
jgi:hypothetical protein